MNLQMRLTLESSPMYRSTKRWLEQLIDRDHRTRSRYYQKRKQVVSDAHQELTKSAKRSPGYVKQDYARDVVASYTPAALAAYHLAVALANMKLSMDFLSYSDKRNYEEGRRAADNDFRQDMANLAKSIQEARRLNIPLEGFLKQHPWAEFFFQF